MRLDSVLAYALSVTLTQALPHAIPDGKYSRLVVFGDSFSDNGNGAWVASDHKWPVDPAYYHHSFSNGPKWNEVAAQDLGLELLDLATGGATTDNAYIAGGTGPDSSIPVPSTADQIANFLKEDKVRPNDIFVHWIGANDVLFDNTASPEKVAGLIKEHIDLLRANGARAVLVANYNDFTKFPGTYNSDYYKTANVKSYNDALTEQLKSLVRKYRCTTFKAGFVDVTDIFRSIYANPTNFGVEKKYLEPPTPCLTGVYKSEGVERNLCTDPEKHIWFDAYHVVKEVHTLIGKKFEKHIRVL